MQLCTNCTQARSVTGNNCDKWHLLYLLSLTLFYMYVHQLRKIRNTAEQQAEMLLVGNDQGATVLVLWYQQETGNCSFPGDS